MVTDWPYTSPDPAYVTTVSWHGSLLVTIDAKECMAQHLVGGPFDRTRCTSQCSYAFQVAEARVRHQAEREAIERDNAQQRRQLSEEECRVAAERVCGHICTDKQLCSLCCS